MRTPSEHPVASHGLPQRKLSRRSTRRAQSTKTKEREREQGPFGIDGIVCSIRVRLGRLYHGWVGYITVHRNAKLESYTYMGKLKRLLNVRLNEGSAKRRGLGCVILFLALPGCSLANSHAFLPISVFITNMTLTL